MKKIIITVLFVTFSFKINAQIAENIKVLNTRYDNFAPSYYNNEVKFEFKKRENIGVPGIGYYSGLLTFAPWADNTGGHHHQLNFNEGGIFYRNGLPDDETWGQWSKILIQKINKPIELGPKSTQGGIIFAQTYADNDYIGTLSSNYSSGAIILGYGAAGMNGSGTSGQLVSTFDNFSANRGALRLGQGTLEFLSTPTAVQTAVNSELNIQSRFFINKLGNVGIGTANPDAKLSVNGTIHSKEVKVDLTGWPDYVFSKEYTLPSLYEVEKHINEKGHLQNIPSAKEVAKDGGIELGEMNRKLLEKIEELTLYTIQQQKEIDELKKENSLLKKLEERINKLEK